MNELAATNDIMQTAMETTAVARTTIEATKSANWPQAAIFIWGISVLGACGAYLISSTKGLIRDGHIKEIDIKNKKVILNDLVQAA